MRWLMSLNTRQKLMVFSSVALAGLLISSMVAGVLLSQVRVDGPIYDRIADSSALLIDVAPPPMFMVEAYTWAAELEHADDPGRFETLVTDGQRLERVLRERFHFWRARVDEPELQRALDGVAFATADAFFRVRDEAYIPALRRGDHALAFALLRGPMSALFSAHREALLELMALAEVHVRAEEARATRLVGRALVAQTLFTLLLVGLFVWLSRRIGLAVVQPLQKAASVLALVAEGDFHVRSNLRGRDELGQLGRALDTTLDSIDMKVSRLLEDMQALSGGDLSRTISVRGQDPLGRLGEGLDGLRRSLLDNLAELKSTASRLTAVASLLRAGAQSLQDQARAEVIQADATRASSQKVGQSLQTMHVAMQQLHTAVVNIQDSARAVSRSSRSLQGLSETNRANFSSLEEASGRVGDVSHLIRGIARQTDLLALNASIEAARAGEAGRGFAVVAREVQHLAADTAHATREISAQADLIGHGTVAAAEVLLTIVDGVELISQTQRRVETAVLDQQAALESFRLDASTVASAFGDVEQVVDEMVESARKTVSFVQALEESMSKIQSLVEGLDALVGRYRVGSSSAIRTLLFMLTLLPCLVQAQYVEDPWSAETLGMGGACRALSSDASAVELNPAALASIRNYLAQTDYRLSAEAQAHQGTLSIVDNLTSKVGTGLLWRFGLAESLPGAPRSGWVVVGEDPETVNRLRAQDYRLGLGVPIGNAFALGTSFGWYRARQGPVPEFAAYPAITRFSFGASALFVPLPYLRLALIGSNLLPTHLPERSTTVALAAGLKADKYLMAEVDLVADVTGKSDLTQQEWSASAITWGVHAGVGALVRGFLPVRAGFYSDGPTGNRFLTGGLGLEAPSFALRYAMRWPLDEGPVMHLASLELRLGEPSGSARR